MLTIVDIPKEIMALHLSSKELARTIISGLASPPTPAAQAHGTDLNAAFPNSFVFILKGIYKNFYSDRFIRFYSAGDIVRTSASPEPIVHRITGEMASEVIAVSEADAVARMAASPELASQWRTYDAIQREILLSLCAAYAGEDFKPTIDLRQFEKGQVIIEEGSSPDCLFEMIEGKASVLVKGTEVGSVNQGEVFGEISFLTASPRTASVVAAANCMVQAVKGGDFDKIVKYRPTLVHSMARTIAKRLTEVNERLVRIASLT
jgi:hypothetical protein